jgi:hypothetical protein
MQPLLTTPSLVRVFRVRALLLASRSRAAAFRAVYAYLGDRPLPPSLPNLPPPGTALLNASIQSTDLNGGLKSMGRIGDGGACLCTRVHTRLRAPREQRWNFRHTQDRRRRPWPKPWFA